MGYRTVYQDAGKGHVAVLLGLKDGADFLGGQLDSLARQTHRDWSLIVSDDGSADLGPAIVRRFAARHRGRVTLVEGPRQGFARNFLSLLDRVPAEARFAAFSDQDDLWRPGKLARAVARLSAEPENRPALYCGPTSLIDAEGRACGTSPVFALPPSFANALVQSIAGGNTMVMNRAARDLLARAARYPGEVPSHDWWAYQVVTGAGGKVIYDPAPQVLYRQHSGNLIGANTGARARLRRLGRLWRGDLRRWTDANIAALRHAGDLLAPENRRLLENFAASREGPLAQRLPGARGLYRQTMPGTLMLRLAAASGRL